jgi:hypothetical protein
LAGDFTLRSNMFGQFQIEFETGETKSADEAGYQKGCQQRGQQEEEKIVRGGESSQADEHNSEREQQPGAGDLLPHPVFE